MDTQQLTKHQKDAISEHDQWKHRLRKAIKKGKCEHQPEHICSGDSCTYGKWLHHELDPENIDQFYFDVIAKTHIEFHEEVADILGLALEGKKAEAKQRIAFGSKLSKLSRTLTKEIKEIELSKH